MVKTRTLTIFIFLIILSIQVVGCQKNNESKTANVNQESAINGEQKSNLSNQSSQSQQSKQQITTNNSKNNLNPEQSSKLQSKPVEITNFQYIGMEDKIGYSQSKPPDRTPDGTPDGHFKVSLCANQEIYLEHANIEAPGYFGGNDKYGWEWEYYTFRNAALYHNSISLMNNRQEYHLQPGSYDFDLYLNGYDVHGSINFESIKPYDLSITGKTKDENIVKASKILDK